MKMPARASRQAAACAVPLGRTEAILLATEVLSARPGCHVVSIWQIAAQAGVRPAMVDCCHGQKHVLFLASFDRWLGRLDEGLQLQAQACEAAPGAHGLTCAVQAFLLPMLCLRNGREGEYCAQLVAQGLVCRTPEAEPVLATHFDPMADAFVAAVQAASLRSTPAAAAWAWQFALGALLHHIIDQRVERPSLAENTAADPAAATMLADFVSAGIAAVRLPSAQSQATPSPSPPTQRRKA